jgi:hypothetical protein
MAYVIIRVVIVFNLFFKANFMSEVSIPYPIYPSQLAFLKDVAELIAASIADNFLVEKLSEFKSIECLAIGLGHESYSSLVQYSKERASLDKESELDLFSESSVVSAVAESYASQLSGVTKEEVEIVCIVLNDKNNYRDVFSTPVAEIDF